MLHLYRKVHREKNHANPAKYLNVALYPASVHGCDSSGQKCHLPPDFLRAATDTALADGYLKCINRHCFNLCGTKEKEAMDGHKVQ